MRQKAGLTLERHREIGAELAQIRDRLVTLACEIGNAYPVTSPQSRAAAKAWPAVDSLRSLLDNTVFMEYPAEASPAIYYGQRNTEGR